MVCFCGEEQDELYECDGGCGELYCDKCIEELNNICEQCDKEIIREEQPFGV